jgi:ubiquitin carboxyl-terminal hydrolase 22/27/51
LRSVLLCEECGGKRKMNEAFLNISLTLSEEVERLQAENGSFKKELSVETCLEHFILPEKLGDGVHCPTCRKKTATKKQHTFAKLPKVLCLHLKRFDAARNKKIDEFVSFPARGLNMGKLLSHWYARIALDALQSMWNDFSLLFFLLLYLYRSEVTRVPSANQEIAAEPRVLYDLFGTVNHIGNMQSGHYVTNVKVADQWYHCNDAHIGRAGVDNGEEAVLKNEGAYILFYIRR